ncbi:unnamed protein product [Ectocarpus sp. 6 AP-2014]
MLLAAPDSICKQKKGMVKRTKKEKQREAFDVDMGVRPASHLRSVSA